MEDPERKLFLDKLNQYNHERDVSLSTNPTVSKQPLDLYRLYLAVKARGGFQDVTKHKLWKEVALSCNLLMNSSMAYTIRKQYIKHLLPFECHFDRGGIDPSVLQSLLENTNRKKSRANISSIGNEGRDSNSHCGYIQPVTTVTMDEYGISNYLSPPSGYPSSSGVINSSYLPDFNQHIMPLLTPQHLSETSKKMGNISSPSNTDSTSQCLFSNAQNDANYTHVTMNNYNTKIYSTLPSEYGHLGYPSQQPQRQYSPHSMRKKRSIPSPGSTDSSSPGSYPQSGTPVEGTFSGHSSNYSDVYLHSSIMDTDYKVNYSRGHNLGSRISPHSRLMKGIPSPSSLDGNSQGSYSNSNPPLMEQFTSQTGQALNNFSNLGNAQYSNYAERSTPTGNSSHSNIPSSNSSAICNEILSAQDPFSDEMQSNGIPYQKHVSKHFNNRNHLSPYSNCESNYPPNSHQSSGLYASHGHSKTRSFSDFKEQNLIDVSLNENINKNIELSTNQNSQYHYKSTNRDSPKIQQASLSSTDHTQKDAGISGQVPNATNVPMEYELCGSPNYDYERDNNRIYDSESRNDGYIHTSNNMNLLHKIPVQSNTQPAPINKTGYLKRPIGQYQQGYSNEFINEMSNYQSQNYGLSAYVDNSSFRLPLVQSSSDSYGTANLNLSPGGSFLKRPCDFAKSEDVTRNYSANNAPSHYDSKYIGSRPKSQPGFSSNEQYPTWSRDNQYRYGSLGSHISPHNIPYSREMTLDQTNASRNESNWSLNRYSQSGPNVNNTSININININSASSIDNNVPPKTNSRKNLDPRNLDSRTVYGPAGNNSEFESVNLTRLLSSSSLPSPSSGNSTDIGSQCTRINTKEPSFPFNCVESTELNLTKRKRLCAKDLPQVDAWRLLMCLKSGLLAESTWALDVLIVLANDDNTILYFGLSHLPGLLETLLDHYKKYLEEMFPCFSLKKNDSYKYKKHCVKEKLDIFLEESLKDNFKDNDKVMLLKGKNYTLISRSGKEVKLKDSNSLFVKNRKLYWKSEETFVEMDHVITSFESKETTLKFAKTIGHNCLNTKKDVIKKVNIDSSEAKCEYKKENEVDQFKSKSRVLEYDELEDEAISSDDEPLNVIQDYCYSLSNRCICLSTLIRNISFVPGNDVEMHKSLLLEILGKLLLFNHVHMEKRQNFNNLINGSCDLNSEFLTDNDSIQDEKIKTENRHKSIYNEKWWSETLHVLRENSLVTLANISGQLDLSPFDENISYPIIDGLLHWSICPSSYAEDPLPSTSLEYLSAKRLALEILVKLSIVESNVDLILATRPWSRLEKLLCYLIKLLNRNEEQTLREFGLVLLSNFISADSAIARATVMYGIVPSLISFIEQSESSALNVANTQGINALRENPELMGTTLDMVRRAAECLRRLSWINENRLVINNHQSRLLNLVMSQILDQDVASIVSCVIYQCSSRDINGDNLLSEKQENTNKDDEEQNEEDSFKSSNKEVYN